jgi:agmatinase
MSWIANNENISRVVQLGIRHLLPKPPFVNDKVQVHVGTNWVDEIDIIISELPDDCPYYLTFDVDCLDPIVIGQTGTPIPGGLSYHNAAKTLATISSRLNLVAMDIVEMISASSLIEGTIVSYLAFEVLSHQYIRRNTHK